VNPSEIAFLVLGMVLGVAGGAALVQAVRTRPAPRREVRVTIAPNSLTARRAMTLAVPGGMRIDQRVPGSPDDAAWDDDRPATPIPAPVRGARHEPDAPHVRTPVPSLPPGIPMTAVAIPIVADPDRVGASASSPTAVVEAIAASTVVVAAGGAALRTVGAARGVAVAEPPEPMPPALAPVQPVASGPGKGERGLDPGPQGNAAASTSPGIEDEACADELQRMTERCAQAETAKEEARRASDALRDARRAYDTLREEVERVPEITNPRHVALAKQQLHDEFRAANERASGPDEAEAAARRWLGEINRLNAEVREAQRRAEAGAAELRAWVPKLERLALEADASRITAETAEAACRAARVDLARCEEQVHESAAAAAAAAEPHPFEGVWPGQEPALATPGSGQDASLDGLPAIIRVLRGDREARDRIVAGMAGTDPDSTRTWQLRLAQLVDAIVACAIEDGQLDVPEDHPFWRMFSVHETRDIVAALSSLGFRYDGLGGFADGRVPSARDLSLAVGYAGLDPMRIRTWPRETELPDLYAGATVAADEWLVGRAGDLSLTEMMEALGPRAADLADTWNAWGRLRPVMLAD
jgi:hypothetical protein